MSQLTENEKWTYRAIFFVAFLVFIVLMYWASRPSWSDNRAETEYTKCIELVLRNGTISDAERMCEDRKQ